MKNADIDWKAIPLALVLAMICLFAGSTADAGGPRGVAGLGVADLRGDGRPDYMYRGRVLYADTVAPSRLPASGGPVVIKGVGFQFSCPSERCARHRH